MRLDDMPKFWVPLVWVEPKDPFDDPVGLCCESRGSERDPEEDFEEEEEEEDFDEEDEDDEDDE